MTRAGRARAMAPAAPTAASTAPIPTGSSTIPRLPRTRRRSGAISGSKAETISVRATSGPHRSASAIVQLRQQAQDLEVEPDEGHQNAEGAVPLHELGRPRPGPLLDEVEVEHQVQRGHDDHQQADADAEGPRRIDEPHLYAEHAQHHGEQVDDRDRAGRRDDTELEPLGRLDRFRLVRTSMTASVPNVSAIAWNAMP